MPGLDDLAKVERHAWAAAEGDTDAVSRALAALCSAMPKMGAIATVVDPRDGETVLYGHHNTDPELLEVLRTRFNSPASHPLMRMLPRYGSNGRATTGMDGELDHYARFYDRGRMTDTEYYDAFKRPSGIGHSGGVVMPCRDGRFVWVTLGCLENRDWLDAEEERLARAALGSVVRAIRMATNYDFGMERASAEHEVHGAAMVLGAHGQVQSANKAATAMLDEGSMMHRQGGVVSFRDPLLDAAFSEACADTIACGSTARLIVPFDEVFRRVTIERGPSRGGRTTIAVSIEDRTPMDWTPEELRLAYELTPREASVAIALASGLDTAEIADRLGIAHGSVRLHLKRCFAKTGVHSQSQLVSALLHARGR